MASSSSDNKVNGTVMLINMYLSKTDASAMLGNFHHGPPVQTYIVHSDKQGLGNNRSLWDRPSNTLGIVLASCEMNSVSQSDLPRLCDNGVVIGFAANLSVDPMFRADTFNCISDFRGLQAVDFFSAVKFGLEKLQKELKGNRAALRYAGRSIGEVDRMMNSVLSLPADEAEDNVTS